MPVFRAEWSGLKESLDFFTRLGATAEQVVAKGVGRAAIRTQEAMRVHLESMVYAQSPAASGYIRTYTLMRSVHAAKPSADHSADEGRASGGADLSAMTPEEVVEKSGNTLVSEVGSWIGYAGYVHEGIHQPQPRPFAEASVAEAEIALDEEIITVILAEFATAPRGA